MKLLQISESDHSGGAERIAYELHRSSVAAGHDSRMLVGYKRGDDPAVTGLVPEKGAGRFLYRCTRWLERRSGQQARHYWMAGAWLRQNPNDWDVFHLHNLHGKYFNLELLPVMAGQAKVVLTLHDCWLFTGHCAHVFDCNRWMTDCHPCCDIKRYPEMERDAARYNLDRKRSLLTKTAPVVVTPSRWLCCLVKKSRVFRNIDLDHRVIYNGIDTRRFCPGNKLAARSQLGLPVDKHLLLYVVNGGLNSSAYKDPALLLSTVEHLAARPLARKFHLVVVGGKKALSSAFVDCVSQIEDTREGLETFYQAADLLVYPTKADNCPLVPMEAMSCGLPVVSTRVGGVPEVVEHGVTGYVTGEGNAAEFSEAVERLISCDSLSRAMGRASIERAHKYFTLEKMASSYFNLYSERP